MHNTRTPKLNSGLAALMMVFSAPSKAADEVVFERPAALEPAVEFWTRVYSEVDSLSGFIHDSRNLDIVYDTLRLNWYDSPQVQERQIARALSGYKDALRALADGERENLTERERKVLAQWGDRADAGTLTAAADRLRFQRGQADRMRDGIARAGAWEKRIRRMLRDAGLPEALAALPHVESSYNPHAQSHAGAAGLWQFTGFTGRHYLRVDHVVDERLDPVRSTEGAIRLLEKYYSRLHSWPLTITAYNHGLSGVRRAVRETGSSDIDVIVQNYAGPRFGFASRNYYPAFLAAMDVAANAQAYFGPLDRHPANDYWVVKLPDYMQFGDLVRQLGLETDAVKSLNPALQQAVWTDNKRLPRGYPLRLPATTANRTITALLTRVKGHNRQIPDRFYRVQEGDTLSAIALRYDHSVGDLMALNNLSSKNMIRVGQSLRLSPSHGDAAVGISALEAIDIADDGEPLRLRAPDTGGESVASVP
jgi:membrane-bound lytic murein transglycosylase D